jgi:hypothetical protein
LQGVRFETVAIDAAPDFVEMYDAAVDVWQDTRTFMSKYNLDKGIGSVSGCELFCTYSFLPALPSSFVCMCMLPCIQEGMAL